MVIDMVRGEQLILRVRFGHVVEERAQGVVRVLAALVGRYLLMAAGGER